MKMITNYEVEGCWTPKDSTSKCRSCGTVLELTPATGHFNSKFWEVAKTGKTRTFANDNIEPKNYHKIETADGLYLHNCPNGCAESTAVEVTKKHIYMYPFKKEGSHSYDLELDYNKIDYFWLSPKGEIIPCEEEGHIDCAYDWIGEASEQDLEENGYAKLTNGLKLFIQSGELTQKQIDTLFDYCILRKLSTKWVGKKDIGTMIDLAKES